ncbi:MAG: DUF1905 domain-containing protein [Gloeobacteraceae cyanobacterium ES-bin-316]|nr:DUF1905 domain-containing protein [Ferruginibacter sp.]
MKIGFDAVLQKFESRGEKTGWTYVTVPKKVTQKLHPGYKKSFRVKGLLDEYTLKSVALIPMGDAQFILPVNAAMRRAIKKTKGLKVSLSLEIDETIVPLSPTFLQCLHDEPAALKNFKLLPPSHQQYYSKWIEPAKTDVTKIKRISIAVNGLARNMDYGAMLREEKQNRLIR